MLVIYRARRTRGLAMEAIAKLFTNGRSQAVRIPKALEFDGVREVVISRHGDGLLLAPVRKSWESFAADAPGVDDDFMVERPDLLGDGRVDL